MPNDPHPLEGQSSLHAAAASNNAQLVDPEGLSDELPILAVVDKNMFTGKIFSTQARISDLDKVHQDLIRTEDGMNRITRHLNRRITRTSRDLDEFKDSTHAFLSHITSKVSHDMHSSPVPHVQALGISIPAPPVTVSDIPSEAANPRVVPLHHELNYEEGDSESEIDPTGFHQVNMLWAESSPTFTIFSGTSPLEFDRWARKFSDLLDCCGRKWDEAEKVARLKACLDGEPRRIFDNLPAAQKASSAEAVKKLKENLDTPQNKEITYQALSMCKQREGESVDEFSARLIPLIEATTTELSLDAREEVLCRAFLDKLNPSLKFLTRTLSGPVRRDFNMMRMNAREAEMMHKESSVPSPFPLCPVTVQNPTLQNSGPPNYPQGNFKTWAPTGANARPIKFNHQNQNKWGSGAQTFRGPRNTTTNPRPWDANKRRSNRMDNWTPQHDRRWNSRPVCNYCGKVGHFALQCFKRREEFTQSSSNVVRVLTDQSELINQLSRKVNDLSLKNNPSAEAASPKINTIHNRLKSNTAVTLAPLDAAPSNSPSSISNWEASASIRPKFHPLVMSLVLLFVIPTVVAKEFNPIPSNPMICQKRLQPMIWSLPGFPSCPRMSIDTSKPLIRQRRTIYFPNSLEYSSKAWACRRIVKRARKYTSLTGVTIEQNLNSEQLLVTHDECQQMALNKRCSLGYLKNDSGLWRTDRKIDLTPRPWLLGSFSWMHVQSENCFAFETEVYSHVGDASIITPAGIAHACPYEKGVCILSDKTAVIWEPKKDKMCKYSPMGVMDGHNLGTVWLSTLGDLGLTSSTVRNITDCGHNITISDQGPAYSINSQSPRPKRGIFGLGSEGVVTSSQLAAQLSYLHANISRSVNVAFAKAFHAFCDFIKDTERWVHSAYLNDPTSLARFIHQDNLLIAERAGVSLLKTWPCISLNPSDYEFRPTQSNSMCFEFVPITFNTNGKKQLAFLNPTDLTISLHSKTAPCEDHKRILVQLADRTFEVDQIEGTISNAYIHKIREVSLDLNKRPGIPKLSPHAFHHLALLNLTDLATHAFATNLAQISQLTYQIDQTTSSEIKTSLSAEWSALEESIVQKAVGNYSLAWQTVVTSCLVFCMLDLLARLIFAYLGVRLNVPIRMLGRPIIDGITRLFNSKPDRASPKVSNHEPLHSVSPSSPPSTETTQTLGLGPQSSNSTEFTQETSKKKSEFAVWLSEHLAQHHNPESPLKLPRNSGELAHFLDIATHFGEEIPNFNSKISPISNISGDTHLLWDKQQVAAYQSVLGHIRMLVHGKIQHSPQFPRTLRACASLPLNNTLPVLLAVSLILVSPTQAAPLHQASFVSDSLSESIFLVSAMISIATAGIMTGFIHSKIRRPASAVIRISCAVSEVKIRLGAITLRSTLNFISDDQAGAMKNYQLILGCDVFTNLPQLTVDFRTQTVMIGNSKLKMETNDDPLTEIKVRALEHWHMLPGTQTIVTAKLDSIFPINKAISIENLDPRLTNENLSTLATVSNPKNNLVKVIICNPTNVPKNIIKDMCIAKASEIPTTGHSPLLIERQDEINLLRESPKIDIDPSFKIDFSKASVSGLDLKNLKQLCEDFRDIFSKSQYDLGSCTVGEHDIITNSTIPISCKPCKTPFKYREALQKHIDQLLASGVMVESDTPWVSNIVLVQKKDGGLRPCIDFRKLNEVTVPDHYPLPRLEAIMERIGNCRYYSSLDLSSGYLQIRLTDGASRKCGLITENKVYQMLNLPFGLRNATSAFARCMAHVLTGLDECVVAYVDDILVFTKEDDINAHLEALRNVFERFRRFNLKLSPKKCTFAAATMNFLGYLINADGYTPSLSKVEIIKNLPEPKNVREVKHVIGMASFFRKHVPNFSTIVEPLTRLTRKEKNFEWGPEQAAAFDEVKRILCGKPVLVFPDYDKPFHIFTDASNVGQGGALAQWSESKEVYEAIAYCSRTMSTSERKWPPVQAELGAIIFALRTFKPYIFMAEIQLHCDHKPLAYLLKKAEAHPHLARWLIELQNYNIRIVHVAGKQNLLADGLSRFPQERTNGIAIKDLRELEDIANFPVCLCLDMTPRVVREHFLLSITARDIEGQTFSIDVRKEQNDDLEVKKLIEFVNCGSFPEGTAETEKEDIAVRAENLSTISGILYHHIPDQHPRMFIPISLRPLIFEAFHTSQLSGGHMNIKKTIGKCRKFYWPMMHRDITNWTRQCITCQLRHSPTPSYRAEMQTPPQNTLFAQIALDLADPLPITRRGNKHILNIICTFTKYVISVPVPDAKAQTIALAFFKNCYLKFGGCTSLLTDNATAFTSEFFKSLCSLFYINKCYAIPHWSQGNAVVERSFRTFHNILAKYISPEEPDFDEFIECANFCYNTSIHSSTKETPFFLMFGRDPIFCIEQILNPNDDHEVITEVDNVKQKLVKSLRKAWQAAAAVIKESQLRSKLQYDKLVRIQSVQVGDRVLLRNYAGKNKTSRKFQLPWKGLFRVIEVNGVFITVVSSTSPQTNPRIVHINQVKKYNDFSGPPCTTRDLQPDEEQALEDSQAKELTNVPEYSHESSLKSPQVNDSPKDPHTPSCASPPNPSIEEPLLVKDGVTRNSQTNYNLRKNPKKKTFE